MPEGAEADPDEDDEREFLGRLADADDVDDVLEEGETQADDTGVDEGVGEAVELTTAPRAGEQHKDQEQALEELLAEGRRDHGSEPVAEQRRVEVVDQAAEECRDAGSPQERDDQQEWWFGFPSVEPAIEDEADRGDDPGHHEGDEFAVGGTVGEEDEDQHQDETDHAEESADDRPDDGVLLHPCP